MMIRILIAFLLICFTTPSISQSVFDVSEQKLKTSVIDTTADAILIYEVSNAVLYFRQKDIGNFISNSKHSKFYSHSFNKLIDTLLSNVKIIKIKDNLFSYDETQINIKASEENNESILKINEELYFLSGELMLRGLFMVYSKQSKSFETINLVARRENGLLGQKNLKFYFSDKKPFYNLVVVLGE